MAFNIAKYQTNIYKNIVGVIKVFGKPMPTAAFHKQDDRLFFNKN